MKENLLSKSSRWAQKALRSYLDSDQEQFFVQAGVSFELLGKAYLVGIHPSLIIDKDFDSLLQVCGAPVHSKRPPGNIRTIGGKEVVTKMIQIIPKLQSYNQQLGLLADLRNGAVHLGISDSTPLSDLNIAFLRSALIVLKECEYPTTSYFGSYDELVGKLIDESSKEVERLVAIKMTKAKEGFQAKFNEMEVKTFEEITGIIFNSFTFYRYETVPLPCPVCGKLAYASGQFNVYWDDEDDSPPEPEVFLNIRYFLCKVCGLELNGHEEILASGLPGTIYIEDVDPKDFAEDFYREE